MNVISAIFKRNFSAYFTSPTGYVFICVFVLVCAFAAFVPPAFFNARLATLDQLNFYFPIIMGLFIPAVTMNIWSDERRLGTDELLLTIPATDLDVVAGKFLAVTAIYTAALALAIVSNLVMLVWMGEPDFGLIFCNFIGYWLVGQVMLAAGMCASLMTANLTIAFIVGVLLNGPLVFVTYIDDIFGDSSFAQQVNSWAIGERLDELNRGVLSLTSVVYFSMLTLALFYVCMVLIGRRHWLGGRDGQSMIWHYLFRASALGVVSVALMVTFRFLDVGRFDLTASRVNSLSKETAVVLEDITTKPLALLEEQRIELAEERAMLIQKKQAVPADEKVADELRTLDRKIRKNELEVRRLNNPIRIEAYVSKQVPTAYVRTRRDLETALAEFEADSGGTIDSTLYFVEKFSKLADQARDQHGINPRRVDAKISGIDTGEEIFLAAAVISGDRKQVIPFFSPGIPVEYELLMAIATITDVKKKRLGIVKTDAPIMEGSGGGGAQRIVDELRKRYEVESVDPTQKINNPDGDKTEHFDVLMVVQPSTLGPVEMRNLIDAIRRGIPTALFEDPFPLIAEFPRTTAGTDQPRVSPPPPGMMGMFQRPPPPGPKGNIRELWDLLGAEMVRSYFAVESAESIVTDRTDYTASTALIWQRFNPYPALRSEQGLTSEWVFVRPTAIGASDAFSDDEITRGLFEVLFIVPGAVVRQRHRSESLTYTELVRTGSEIGVISREHFQETLGSFGREGDPNLARVYEQPQLDSRGVPVNVDSYCLAARITGEVPNRSTQSGGDVEDEGSLAAAETKIDVILVSDIDMLHTAFFEMRENPDPKYPFEFQNVPFVLNVVDGLAGGDRAERFMRIRKQRRAYGDLTRVRREESNRNQKINEAIDEAAKEYKDTLDDANKSMRAAVKELVDAAAEFRKKGDFQQTITAMQKVELKQRDEERRIAALTKQQKTKRDRLIEKSEREREGEIRRIEARFKLIAILLPPIPPLMVAIIVYITRRARESEGVAAARLR